MKIKIKKVNPLAKIPRYAHPTDAGMDLFSVKDLTVGPGETVICPTGISLAIPEGYVGLIWDKSGLAGKNEIKTMGGVIDSGYRGEVGIILKNLSKQEHKINVGDKIAQMLIQKVVHPELVEVDNLEETERGTGGFGSTGI
jgi:dUTP pyrophosphatase